MLREHERQYLSVKRAVPESDDAVHPDRHESTTLALENRRAEGPAGAAKDILAGKLDGETHPAVVGWIASAPVDRLLHPVGASSGDGEPARVNRVQNRLCSLSTARLLEPMVMSAWKIPFTPTVAPSGGGLDPSVTTVRVPVPSLT